MAAHGGIPTKEDWETVERLVKFLEHFHKLTKKVSGSWCVTCSMALPEISDLYTKMKKLEVDVDPNIVTKAKRMIGKFDKCWGLTEKLNNVICYAYVLGPRCKLEFLEFTMCNLNGPIRRKFVVENVKLEMARLYSEYEIASDASSSVINYVSASASGTDGSTFGDADDLFMTVEEFTMRRMTATGNSSTKKKTELDNYLAEEVDPYTTQFDVLML